MAPKLYYFDLYGRAEPIRWAFTLAGVEFEDVRVTGDSWKALKEEDNKLEFGQIPMLELDDGTKLCQGDAILGYLNATLCKDGLQQSDDAMAHYNAQCTTILHGDDFVTKHVVGAFFKPDAEKAAAFASCLTEKMPDYLKHMERRLPAEGFLLGAKMSTYDIKIGVFYAMLA